MKIYWYNGSKNIIGPFVLKLRKDSGMTQEEVAEQMQLRGVESSALTILRIEKGMRFVTDYEIRALADLFHVNITALFPDNTDTSIDQS